MKDGRGNTLHRRLFVVETNGAGQMIVRQPTLFLDITPAAADTCPVSTLPTPDRTLAEQFLYQEALQKWLRDSSAQREHEIEMVSRHVEISLHALIDRQQHQLAEYIDRKVEGQTVTGLDGLIAQTEQHIDDLNNRLESRRKELENEHHCSIGDIRLVGRALVFPHPERENPQFKPMVRDEEIERIAVETAKRHEEARGFVVESVEAENRGFDLISRKPHPEDSKTFTEVRFIEVKGRAGVGEIFLSANEYRAADRLKTDYWLYAAFNCAATPELHTVQNPAQLQWQPVTKVEQYKISPQPSNKLDHEHYLLPKAINRGRSSHRSYFRARAAEKSIRHGHIATLHIWWARRPLAACRAVICAALWPDPVDLSAWLEKGEEVPAGDSIVRPVRFLDTAQKCMIDWGKRHLSKVSSELYSTFIKIQQGTTTFDDPAQLRRALLDFIADFANWDNSTDKDYLETARKLTQAAHEALGGEKGTRPLVVDPFAGGGSIPLEALRVGADAFASDLNPVAVLLNKVVLEYIPKYGQRLADEVRKWGDWVQDSAERELAEFYPDDANGNTAIGYLWARTIISEAPGPDEYPVEVPLLRTLWLAKASSQDRALRWVRNEAGSVKTKIIDVHYADGTTRKVRRPMLEIFSPTKASDVTNGTVARGSATCPVTGYTTPVASVRKQLKNRFGGAADARMLAVRQTNPKTNDRTYRLPIEEDERANDAATQALTAAQQRYGGLVPLIPNEPTPMGGGSGAGRAFSQRNYGMDRFCDLFTPRQLLALTTYARAIRDAGDQIRRNSGSEFAQAVQCCLALSFGRLSDFCSSLCVLNATGNRGCKATFARQALPIVWDFMETVPMNRVGANWIGGIETLEATIRTQAILGTIGHVERASATEHPLPDDVASGLITDPPYYDAVPYSDLLRLFLRLVEARASSEYGLR